ncbi:MBL fold metallo-hydrolase [Paenibacillus sp. VCA1]|uniref:MBL fold metallo-hydrolase n=1 Tax=Paenibacillus sp. VCA1 TaxID=3039148 RepID=UPI0028711BB1|nr:MBL fold metallo-hydrolase [Paenibacillus sp. VCA1]MDR9857592.1 MBL fold metallo-hydrolase [Paenibacillus sp. VCA1]
MMELKVWGGAGEHGRSCYVLTGNQHRIMLDCGVKKEGAGQYPLLEENLIPGLTAVFLSHAHEDHSMALPLLYKLGYRGEIWSTRPTVKQLELYFANWRKYVTGRKGELPYDETHISAMRFRILEDEIERGEWLEIKEGLQFQWGRSGHMLGSVWLRIHMEDHHLFYSGDFSRESELLTVDPPGESFSHDSASDCHPFPPKMTLSIIDNAYGMNEESQDQKLNTLSRYILGVLERGGHALLPVPAFGRGQDLLIWAMRQFPERRIVVEREIVEGLRQMAEWEDWLRPEACHEIELALRSSRLHIPENQEERISLLQVSDPLIVFTTDGMMESQRARWYAERLSSSPLHAVIITGHASEGTFARRLLKGEAGESSCEVVRMGYKIHQGLNDVRLMLNQISSRHTVLVHAPKPETDQVIFDLEREGHRGMLSLHPGAAITFNYR